MSMKRWLATLIQSKFLRESPLFDGTISELANTLRNQYSDRADRYANLIELHSAADSGYVQMKVREFKTRTIEQFVELVNDDTRWSAFDSQVMAQYFDDHIVLFPFSSEGENDLDREFDRPDHQGMKFPNPLPFFVIQKAMIERRFSRGETTEIGERDLRDAISCLRYVFVKNFWRLVLSRRSIVAGFLAVVLGFQMVLSGVLIVDATGLWRHIGLSPDDAALIILGAGAAFAASIVASYVFSVGMMKDHTAVYSTALQATSSSLSRGLETRINNLIALVQLFFAQMSNSKMDLKGENRLGEWPQEVQKWTKLAFWVDARVEHIDLYMQVQMWRIRRLHFGIRWLGRQLSRGLALVTAGAALLISIVAFGFISLHSDPTSDRALPLFGVLAAGMANAFFSVFLSRQTFSLHTPEVDIIKDTLNTEALQSYRNLKLHHQVANMFRRDKQTELHEEEKGKR